MIRKSSSNRNFLIFCLQNLIDCWSSGKGSSWQSNDVKDCLESINLSLLTGSEIQSLILSPLGDDDELVLIISKMTNKVIVPGLVAGFELEKEQWRNEMKNLLFQIEELNSEVEILRPMKQKVVDEENERRRIELSKNLFNSNSCGPQLSLSNNNSVVKKNGVSGMDNSFVEVNITGNCSVIFTRLDNLHGDGKTDFIGWKNRSSLQHNSGPSPYICPRGSGHGSFSPSNPSFPTITKGESITVSFSNGKAHFKPSTCTNTFTIDIPSYLVFGMLVYGQNHVWKVERV
ncbi:hypothetical protein GEMRC1_000468 [Eukaryota sp. GEM-RC1]